MMPNVTRGSRMGGLMRYLAGPGKANEHTNPHLVGGDDTLMSWFGREELSAGDAQLVARHLDAPRVEAEALLGEHAPQVKGGHVWHCSLSLAAAEGQLSDDQWQQIASDFMAEMQWRVDAADAGTSMDELGAAAARAEGTRVGGARAAGAPRSTSASTSRSAVGAAVEGPEGGGSGLAVVGRTPTVLRWAAVRHGVSKNGNDHVHLVVNLVAEGGAVANPYRDFLRAQSASRTLERQHGLAQLPSAARGQSVRGWKPAEQQAAARRTAVARVENARLHGPVGYLGVGMSRGWSDMDAAARKAAIAGSTKSAGGVLGEAMGMDQPRRVLEIAVRGASTASRSEDEFVRRLREAGVLVRPRYKEGSTRDGQVEVTGFSVALAPRYSSSLGEHPVWYGGGRLARDLTLPRLRSGWDHPEGTTPAAAAEWKAAARGRRAVAPASARREAKRFSPRAMSIQAERVADMNWRLAQVPAQRRPEWAKVAGASAGTLSAWAMSAARSSDAQVAAMAPTLAAAAQTLAVSASTVAAQPRSTTLGTTSMTGMAMLLASAARGGQGAMGQAVLVTQMISLLEAVIQMAAERRELDTVVALRTGVQDRLRPVAQALAQQEQRSSALIRAGRGEAVAGPGDAATSGAALSGASAASPAPAKAPASTPSGSGSGSGARRRTWGERAVGVPAVASGSPSSGGRAAGTTAASTHVSHQADGPDTAQEVAPAGEDPHTTAMQNLRRLAAQQAAQQAEQQAQRDHEYE